MYLNYYAAEVNDEDDNPPIGLILCTDKGNVDMQYALGGLSNNMMSGAFAPDIILLQSKDLLEQWVEELNHFLVIDEEPPVYATKGR